MKKITTFLACLFVGILFAQEKGSISGMITDKESNDSPLPFANVVLKGTTIGTATDFDGKYTIDNIPVLSLIHI